MNRAKCPETKAEYDHRQSKITRVVDPETGRIRYCSLMDHKNSQPKPMTMHTFQLNLIHVD